MSATAFIERIERPDCMEFSLCVCKEGSKGHDLVDFYQSKRAAISAAKKMFGKKVNIIDRSE